MLELARSIFSSTELNTDFIFEIVTLLIILRVFEIIGGMARGGKW